MTKTDKPKRHPRAPSRDWTKEPYRSQIKAALEDHFGNIVQTAKALRCNRDNLTRLIREDPELSAAREKAQEGIYCKAVDALAKRVEEGNVSAIALVLRVSPWARRRGWGDHLKVSGEGNTADLATQAREIFGLSNPPPEETPEK